jgi:ABC-2 type transport system ATP-binding protein
LLKEFGLWERRASIAQTFSKGMKRRLCFAMGLIHEPEVLFLDEPMSGLDVESRVLLRERIQGLRASGVTIFLTTHDMHDAELLSDRVAIILRGKLKAINTPEVLRKQLTSVVTVSVELKGSLNGAELGIIRGVIEPPKIDDHGRWNLKTKNPEVVIPEILRFATERSLLVPWIQTLEPSLEDVFLNLVSSDVHPSSKKLTV